MSSASARKLAKKLPERDTKLGNNEIVLAWVDEAAGRYEVRSCGDVMPTYLYNQAKDAGRVLKVDEIFRFRKKNDRGNIVECRVTCVRTPNGFLRADYDDADKKANRERRRIREAKAGELKRLYGLNDDAIKALEQSAGLAQMLPATAWLASALNAQGGGDVVRNLLIVIFRSTGKFSEEEFRDILGHVGFEPPAETARAFTSVCYGVKTLLTEIGFKGGVTDISGQPESNGHGEDHLSAEEIGTTAEDGADPFADLTAEEIDESEEETEAELAAA